MLKHITNNQIPIIEEAKGGYWECYKDKKVWHANKIKFRDVPSEEEYIINQELDNMSLQDIYDKQKENRKGKGHFISLKSGDSFEGVFVGVEETTGQFGDVNSFTFLVEGEEKVLNSKSFRLLSNMIDAGVKESDKVKITKEGAGFKTTYQVEKLS